MFMGDARPQELPRELVAEIVKCAAQASPTACKTLCLVNWWCYLLALPYLFNTVILPTSASGVLFTTMLSLRAELRDANETPVTQDSNQSVAEETPRRLSGYVRNLWMHPAVERVYDLMKCCCNVEHVAMDQVTLQWFLGESSLRAWYGSPSAGKRNQPLQALIIDVDTSWNSPLVIAKGYGFESPPAGDITHLRLAAWGPMLYTEEILNISPFPQLTHLAISLYLHVSRDRAIQLRVCLERQQAALEHLLQNPALEMVVCVPVRSEDRDLAWGWLRDVRRKYGNAYLVESTGRGLREEWEDEVRGGESIWERAVEYTQKVAEAGCDAQTQLV